ncbi:hypothetical protein [Haloferax volcanii]|uniref:hypothetical protein n=1 Tax=Haloferax volcanii TaxID=2246 RepID=UPI0023D9C26E|nr:hypothetical protein [Haloferax lucentense]WEL26858.1 ABC-type Fe3 -hydroxamate transport system, periplasmic component [Haloferax lucentense]
MVNKYKRLTRRDYVKYGAAAATAALAGCGGQSASDPPTTEANTTATPTDDERYAATLSPAGRVEFTEPPENVFTVLLHHADMAVALGQGESLNGMYNPEGFGQLYDLLSFFKARIPPFTAGVKPTTTSRSTVGCRPNTPRLRAFIRIGCVETSTAK